MAPGEQNVTAACRPKGQAAGIPFFFEPCVSSINSGHKKSISTFFLVFLFFGHKKYDHALSLGAADVFQEG